MKRLLSATILFSIITAIVCLPMLLSGTPSARAEEKTKLSQGFVKGTPELQSIGALSFGPEGLLVIADPRAGAVICVETNNDKGARVASPARIEALDALLAAKLGAPAAGIRIQDMQVNPLSGRVYLSVTKIDDQKPVLMSIGLDGAPQLVMLDNVSYGKISLPTKEGVRLNLITDVEFARDRIIVAAQATEQFASKIYTIRLPFTHGGKADVFSTETFHVSHNRLETNAPIRTLTTYNDGNQDVVVGAFTCTPVVKYPMGEMGPDAVVRGTSVVELGSRNQPLDLFFYKRNGQDFLLVSNNNHGVLKVTASVFKETDKIDERALHRRRIADGTFPAMEGIEEIKQLQGTLEMSPALPNHVVVIRKTESGLALETVSLP